MKKLTKLLGIIAIGAVIATGMAGCDMGNDPVDERPGVDLPAITEGTTGRTSITGNNIALEAGRGVTQTFVNSLNLPGEQNQNGVTWSVTNGKLTFSLGTPSQTVALNAEMIGSQGGWTNIQVSSSDVQVYMVEEFEFYTEETSGNRYERINYNVARDAFETDEETYYRSSQIIYVYVSQDVTASGQSGQDEETTYNAFNYSLKAGWNLIQMDAYATPSSETLSIGIATKDVLWTVTETGRSGHSTGGGQPNTLVIQNIPADVYSQGADGQVGILPAGTPEDEAFQRQEEVAVAGVSFSDGNITVEGSGPYTLILPLHVIGDNTTPWTESGAYDIYVVLFSNGEPHYYKAASVTISSETTYVDFSSATEVFP